MARAERLLFRRRVPIDNNVSECEMKRVVLNRKTSLFVGNARGGRSAAILASLTSTCRRHEVNPQLYSTQLLIKLAAVQIRQLSKWLPDQWKRTQAARTVTLKTVLSAASVLGLR
jgi:transposase